MKKPAVVVGTWGDKGSRPGSRPAAQSQVPIEALEAFAWLLDSSIPLPGTRFRIGLDSLLGLVPVIGDAVGALLSSYILFMAAKMGVPRVTLLRMGFNVTLDAALGLIPFAGDLFDFAWKANRRNVALLRAHLDHPGRARRGDWFFAALFLLGVLGLFYLFGWLGFYLQHIIRGFFAG